MYDSVCPAQLQAGLGENYNDELLNYDIVGKDENLQSKNPQKPPAPPPPSANYDDVMLIPNYDLIGEDENLKSKNNGKKPPAPPPPSSSKGGTNYDDVVLISNYDLVGGDENLKSERKGKKPLAPPPLSTSEWDPKTTILSEYSEVSVAAEVLVSKDPQMEYNCLIHQRSESAPVRKTTCMLPECYSMVTPSW